MRESGGERGVMVCAERRSPQITTDEPGPSEWRKVMEIVGGVGVI